MKSPCDIRFLNLPKNTKLLSGLTLKGIKTFCLTCFLLTSGVFALQAQEMDYGVHANIIYRFTKYIDWPENKKTGDFVIGIVGETPLNEYLKNFVVKKMAGSQKIIVKTYSPSSSMFDCHILFISENESSTLKKIVARTAGTSTLIVSEEEGLAQKGSCINFIIADDRLKLEFNKTNIEQRHLNIATELLGLGTIVRSAAR